MGDRRRAVRRASHHARLVAGIGGVAVELYKDIALGITPVTDVEVAAMLDRLQGRALLAGFRGAPPADRPALLDVMQRISALVEPRLDD